MANGDYGALEQNPNRLLVEGRDDERSVMSLLARHGVDWNSLAPLGVPYVHDSGGCEPLIASIPASAKTYDRLGILLDANASIANRWRQVRGRLAEVGVETPNDPHSNGTIFSGITADRRIGVWIMPNNRTQGTLEDFLAFLIPPDDNCWAFSQEVIRGARERGAQVSATNEMKARIHSWLAWQRDPGLRFGPAITEEYFRHDADGALLFVAWFKELFFG